MASKKQIIKHILGFTVSVLLTRVCEVKTEDFPETSMTLQFSYTDGPPRQIRHRRAESFIEYQAEMEINAPNSSAIDELRRLLENYLAQPIFTTAEYNMTLSDLAFTTVCNLSDTGYQCKCENQHLWSCDKCEEYGSCNKTEDTCSCINAKPNDGQFCQPISKFTGTTTCATVPTQTPVYSEVVQMSLILKEAFDFSLTNSTSESYKIKAQHIQSTVEKGYSTLSNYINNSVKVTRFRSGSIIADYTINATNKNLDFKSANTQVSAAFGSTDVTFFLSEQKNLSSTALVYPQEKLVLTCPQYVEGEITWKVNGKDSDGTKHDTSRNGFLTVNNVSESDGGEYSCTITTQPLPRVQWQKILIQPQPSITVGESERLFPCDGRTVELTCCVNTGYNIQWLLNDIVQVSAPLGDCITLKHQIQRGDCSDKIFTCRLKDLPQLLGYSYSNRSVTIKTSTEKFDCVDNILGSGKLADTTEGTCDSDKEGNKIYKCDTGVWKLIRDNCVLKVIKNLESQVQSLTVAEIPGFMTNLSNAVQQNDAVITQSNVTVKTIVEILAKIADESQNIPINEPVMKDFLHTVDIIISDKSSGTWQTLNSGNTAPNTSTELLLAIESISGHLSDVNFTVTQPSIQLNRNIIQSNFSVISHLPNSTTQFVIPNISKPTAITVIFFSNLDNVLPARNTSNNDSASSENRINGDVVVVKVNQTINNVSFTFDLTNASLGNPQCVFWNFDLNYWDSAGCKVKLLENETDKITCECNHTTSFSILMSPFAVNHLFLDYITYIGVSVSMVSLVLCLIIEMIVWKSIRRNDTAYMRHVSIVNIAVSLLIANICFIIGATLANPGASTPVNSCSTAVFFMHFFYLSVFFWMLISALLLLYRTVMVLSQMSRTKMMVIAFTVGYCAPLLIAVITVASTAGAGRYIWARDACWLNWHESKALLAFVIPALTIVAFNLLVLMVVLYKMLRRGVGASSQPDEKHALKIIVRCVAILTPIFGLTWGFGIGTMVSPNLPIHVVFTILNSFQGLFVLLFGTLLDSKVREALAGRLSLKNLSSSPTRTTNAGTSSGLGFLDRLRRRNVYNTSDPRTSAATNSSSAYDALMNP